MDLKLRGRASQTDPVSPAAIDTPLAKQVLERIRRVRPGFVTTYGDLCPEAPRFAGSVLAACEDPDIPWQRIVCGRWLARQGRAAAPPAGVGGVPFRGRRVDMSEAWMPIEDGTA